VVGRRAGAVPRHGERCVHRLRSRSESDVTEDDGGTPIEGSCDPAFEAVRQAFADNFALRGEVGAAVCVVVHGRTVVDLAGGWADHDRRRAWMPTTPVNVFSVGKPLSALVALRLVAEGRLDLDAPIAGWWPEFAAAGKESVTLRQVLSHRAGLPAVRRRLPPGAMFEWDLMCSALAAQEPWWGPGSAHGYHVNTYGFLVGEVIRRVTGRSVGALVADWIAGPIGADLSIGIPADRDGEVAEFLWPDTFVAPEEEPAGMSADALMVHNTYFNPSGFSGAGVVNTAGWRRAEIPSTNVHGTARGVARLYEAMAGGGAVDGVRIVEQELLAAATDEVSVGEDRVLARPSRFGLGFQLTQPERPLGPNPGAFGHFGAGGSLGFGDPEAGVAFGYVMNNVGPRWQNPLNGALIDAVYESLGT